MQTLVNLIDKIKNKNKVLLMFDYDGTLTPIVDNPELAILKPQIKSYLEKIADLDFIKLAFVSGRDVNALKKLSSIEHPQISMYGLYGGEVFNNGKFSVTPSLDIKAQISDVKKLIQELFVLPGIYIEDKIYSLSLHYRHADTSTALKSIALFKQKTEHLINESNFVYHEGKKVVELAPMSFNKLYPVKKLIVENPDFFPVYFGDDEPDIEALKEVKSRNGLAVGVGRLPDNAVNINVTIGDIYNFLKTISEKTL